MSLNDILNNRSQQLALVIGNGINRYNSDGNLNSWDAMLLDLWIKHTDDDPKDIPLGISLTEFYDALDLSSKSKTKNLQKEFCDLLVGWNPKPHHQAMMAWAKRHSAPVLTTNFDETLSDCASLKLRHTDAVRFTDYYPWASYFSVTEIQNPAREFGVWHINGIKRYSRSIRLGLSHYMGSVERARALIHKGGKGRLFAESNHGKWNGHATWLHIIFNNDLLFIGLGLDTSEIFLRWLLIERAKYFKAFPDRAKKAYYVHAGRDLSQGQTIFLKSVGCEIIKETSYDALYGDCWSIF
jgi:hypothetical protein